MQTLKVASSGTGPALVLLHGWGMSSGVWEALKPHLENLFTVYYIDLPGHGINAGYEIDADLDSWVEVLCSAAPANAIWLGWSLGAELALAVAARCPQRVDRLIMVAASPKFVQAADWRPGVSADLFAGFESGVKAHLKHTLERFIKLQVLGSVRRKEIYQQLQAVLEQGSILNWQGLQAGLLLLKNLDLRDDFRHLSMPAMVILGRHDRLVALEAGHMMQRLNSAIAVEIMDDSGHVPFLSQPEMFVSKLGNWL